MSKHICVYFDDGGPEPACVCGESAVVLIDEGGVEVLAVVDRPLDAAEVRQLRRSSDHTLAVPA